MLRGGGEAGCLRIDEIRCFMNRHFALHKVNFPKEHPAIFQITLLTERECVQYACQCFHSNKEPDSCIIIHVIL